MDNAGVDGGGGIKDCTASFAAFVISSMDNAGAGAGADEVIKFCTIFVAAFVISSMDGVDCGGGGGGGEIIKLRTSCSAASMIL